MIVMAAIIAGALPMFAGVSITSPTNGATVSSPVHVTASASSSTSASITSMRIYLDNVNVYTVNGSSLNTYINASTGSHSLVVQAWDANGSVYKSTETISVSSATSASVASTSLSISTSSTLPAATVKDPYSVTLAVTGGTAPYVWSQYSGALPSGLAVQNTGSISGTPLASGVFSFTLQAKDSKGVSTTKAFSLTVKTSTYARAYYVSTTGNDNNAGTASAPWRTITHAGSVVSAGSIVHVAPGTYNEAVVTRANGTSSARIRYISDTKWGAKIRSTTTFTWRNYGSYVDIVGFDVSGSGAKGIGHDGSFGRIMYNYVHDIPAAGCTSAGGAGIVMQNYSATDNDMIGNLIYNIGPPASWGTCYRVHGLYHANLRGHITNNIVIGSAAYGINMWHAASRVVVANNTVIANRAGGICVGDGDSPGGVVNDYTMVVNNVVVNNKRWGIVESGATGTHNAYRNNLIYGTDGTNLRLQNGLTATGTMYSAPMFVNNTGTPQGDYRLQSSSAGANGGTYYNAPIDDIVGGERPYGSTWSAGAYQWGSTPSSYPAR